MKKIICLLLGIFIFFNFSVDLASAEKGDFYEKYESEFEIFSKSHKKMLKAYDLDTNTFDCGTTQLYCHANSIAYSFIIGFLNFVITGLDNVIVTNSWFITEPSFVKYKGYFETLTTSLFGIFLVWQIMSGYAKRFTNIDETDELINEKFLKTVVGAAFLGLYNQIFNLIISLQNSMTSGILKFGVDKESFAFLVFKYSPKNSFLIGLLICIILAIFLLVISYRYISFSFMFIVGPLAIVTIVNEEFNYFSLWWKYIVNNVVTIVLQSIAFILAVGSLTLQYSFLKALPDGAEIVMGIVIGLGFCVFALVIPGILGNLGGSSGTGRSLGKLVRIMAMKK